MPAHVTGYQPKSAMAQSAVEAETPPSDEDDFDLFAAFVEETQEIEEAEDPQEVLQRLIAARMETGKHSEPASRAMEAPLPSLPASPEKTENPAYIKVEIR